MVDGDGFVTKATELRDRIALIKEQMDGLDVTRGEQAEQAIKVFELSSRRRNSLLRNAKAPRTLAEGLLISSNRGDRIRTCDLNTPSVAL